MLKFCLLSELQMEKLSRIIVVEHKLYLFVRLDMLQVPPVGIQIVLHVIVGYNQYRISGVVL